MNPKEENSPTTTRLLRYFIFGISVAKVERLAREKHLRGGAEEVIGARVCSTIGTKIRAFLRGKIREVRWLAMS